ncbi:PQQ-binding-like beta-propeller repeat protein [Rhodococcus sp. Z13]|uniref:PQQ-binding-like beta-propeller repeat protein n=1 Tax=Rhodococcus sacchari TaxID=2962047 RepID=A0ACD4DCJ5_9NOCA|nr:PQQ-binding-like beta-propeller repeat protein [Rhodococcus sp. Z13]UYP17804.1 PQQ-binding-like beta-propeller repeat protein [Rhodococcus sp. Z13]
MLAPERRTRTDLLVALALVATVLVAASVVWFRSDARGTTSITWDEPVPGLTAAGSPPSALEEAWRAPSAASTRPILAGATVATADGGTVIGRDPASGKERWRYERDRPLCGAVESWGDVVSVYHDPRGCGQVTSLEAGSGARGAQRSSDADDPIRLVDAGSHLIAFGDTRLEMWRSDLVRTVEYGRVDAPVNPNAQPRADCELLSAAASGTVLAVLEQCEGEAANRLTLLDPVPDDSQKPQEFASSVLPEAPRGSGARIVSVSGDLTVVYLPPVGASGPRIGTYDEDGALVDVHDLRSPASDADTVARELAGVLVWWTGTDTVGLSPTDTRPLWTVPGTLGEGDVVAGSLLLPVEGALLAVDPATGAVDRRVEVARDAAGEDPVSVTVAGELVLEQRGDEVVALRRP